ncbi:uncharacterized protein LOC114754150 [Neltuma alba]|uniref:uncharacterized protein LOC114754150 n=1 Tax=Neltuma alba TaxID=207710 RepID=UPI0010A3565F|nr:uncharacterized protein LOC114754150 [Prosopis alba]
MSVRCKVEGCPWKICANAVGKKTPFLCVTTFVNEHVHSVQDNLQVSHGGRASLTSAIIIDEVRNHIDKRPTEIMTILKRDCGVNLTYKQAYRAKEKVATGNNIFERVFIAYRCCIEGFLTGGRHILYIDGTHLSGLYKGTLLSASAYDAKNELLPFAIAIVKGEIYEDWSWFLHMIKNIIGSNQLTIVSDRHNSIIAAVRTIFGSERHAYCYRHVKENFSAELVKANRGKRKTSKSMKEDGLQLLDNIAYARLDGEFDKAMDHMHRFSPQLF